MKSNNYTNRYGYTLCFSECRYPNYYWVDSNGYVVPGSYFHSEIFAIKWLENIYLSDEFKYNYKFHSKLNNIIE